MSWDEIESYQWFDFDPPSNEPSELSLEIRSGSDVAKQEIRCKIPDGFRGPLDSLLREKVTTTRHSLAKSRLEDR